MTGTEGDDVIVVTGSATVDALGGDDTICATSGSVTVDAGAGDDTVEISGSASDQTTLGAGVNTYRNSVTDLDSAPTGTVHSGVHGSANHDTLDLGPADVHPDLILPPGSYLNIDFGAAFQVPGNPDFLAITGDPDDTGRWDIRAGQIIRNGDSVGTFTGFTELRGTFVFASTTHVHMSGSGQVEAAVGAGHVQAHLNGATDGYLALVPDLAGQFPVGGDLKGSKNQALGLEVDDARAITSTDNSRLTVDSHTLRISRFNSFRFAARRVTYRGSPHHDYINTYACRAHLDGGAGEDHLGIDTFKDNWGPVPRCSTFHAVEHGGPGNDRLYGGRGPDTLIGGPGRDYAFGQGSHDTCRAEKQTNC